MSQITNHQRQALFSTTFFTYGENGNWEVSDDLWIYWATTVPATVAVVVFWRVWLDYGEVWLGYGDVIYKRSKGLVLGMWKGARGSVMSRTGTRRMRTENRMENDVEDDVVPGGSRTGAVTV